MIRFSRQLKIGVRLQLILIILLGLAVYGNSIKGEFIWDDSFQIVKNSHITSWSNLAAVCSEYMGSGSRYSTPFYRPLQGVTYMLDYSLYKLNPAGFHVTNILLHILVGLALYWLIRLLFSNQGLALLSSLLFVVHPVNTEAVSFISDRADLLVALFMLLCLVCYIKYSQSRSIKAGVLAILSFIFALLSKENSLILPALLLLHHYLFTPNFKIRDFILPLLISIALIAFRTVVLKPVLPALVNPALLMQKLPLFFAGIADYLALIILPVNLHLEHSYRVFNFADPKVIIGAAITFLLIIYAFIKRKDNPLISFGIFWFFIALLPVSNVYLTNLSYIAERWLYLPAIGPVIILAGGLSTLAKPRKLRWAALSLIIAIMAFYSFLTVKQNEYWANPISFCKKTLEYNPQSWKIYNELGLQYWRIGNYEKAMAAYQKALEIKPDLSGIVDNFINAYEALKKEKASGYRKTGGKNFVLANRYYEDGNEYLAVGHTQEAIVLYKEALKLDADNPLFSLALGNAYTVAGSYGEAIAIFEKALAIDPGLAVIHNNLALAYYYNKQYDLAIAHCDKAIALGYKVTPKLLKLLKPYRK